MHQTHVLYYSDVYDNVCVHMENENSLIIIFDIFNNPE